MGEQPPNMETVGTVQERMLNANHAPPPPPKFDLDDPSAWQTFRDQDREYYYHTASGHVTWHKPWADNSTEKPGPVVELSEAWTRHFFQELVGSAIAGTISCGVAFGVVKNTFDSVAPGGQMDFQSGMNYYNNLTFAIGMSLAYACGIGVSYVGQLNPSFTVALALLGAKKWRHVLPSCIGQLVGYFIGNALFYSLIGPYVPHWDQMTGAAFSNIHLKDKALLFVSVFTASNGPGKVLDPLNAGAVVYTMSNGACFWNGTLLTSMLIVVVVPIFASPQKLHRVVEPLIIATIICVFVLGSVSMGATLNPAQYLSGVTFCSMAGWPNEIWSQHNNYIWTALFSPFVGSVLGCICLKLYFIALFHHPVYWTTELTRMVVGIWHGLVPMTWGRLKIKQYNAARSTKQDDGSSSQMAQP